MKALKIIVAVLLVTSTMGMSIAPMAAQAEENPERAVSGTAIYGSASPDSFDPDDGGIVVSMGSEEESPPVDLGTGEPDDPYAELPDTAKKDIKNGEASVVLPIEQSQEKSVLQASPNAAFTVKLPTTLAHKAASFYYRAQGSGSWLEGSYATDSSSIILSLPASAMGEGVVYEYVASFLTPTSLTNIAVNRYNKIVGTISVAADGTWTHVNKNGEPTGLYNETKNADGVTLAVLKAPTYLQYKAKPFEVRTEPRAAYWDTSLVDSLDGTPFDLCTYSSFGVTFYVPSESANVTAAARTALAGAGYPVVTGTVTDPGANTISTADLSFAYSLNTPSYARAYGLYYPKGTGTDVLIPDASSKHTFTSTKVMWSTFTLKLEQTSYAVLIRGLYEGTEIQGATPEDNALFTVGDGPGGKNVVFNVASGTQTVSLNLVCSGLYTVPLRFTINADSGTVSFDNQAEAASKCESLSYGSGTLDLRQMLLLSVVDKGSQVVAASDEVLQYIQKTRSYAPGIVAAGKFGVYNPDPDKAYRIVGYRVDPDHARFSDLLRSNTVAIKKYFATYYPDRTFAGFEYLYDFEGITGKTPSEALLEMYQAEYPGISSLGDLPVSVITHEILYDGGDWRFPQDKVDLSNERVISIIDGSGYSVLETDPVIIDLANKILYEDSLSVTFDNVKYPLSPYLNSLDEPTGAPDERLRLLYSSYRDRADASNAMMADILSSLPVLRPAGQAGDSITFNNFAFGVNGNYIHNPYRLSNYEVNFDFNMILSVVGIEGIAFIDGNVDGVWQDGEQVLANVEFRLYNPDGSLYGTYQTDANGRYEIPFVPEAQGYRMEVTTPDGYDITSVLVAGDINGNKFKAATGDTDSFDVAVDEAYRYNAGFVVQAKKHTITYDPNGGHGTVVDAQSPYNEGAFATILDHGYNQGTSTGFSRMGFRFIGWNDQPDGKGTAYAADDTVLMDRDRVIYAQWELIRSEDPVDPDDPDDPGQPQDPEKPGPADPSNPKGSPDPQAPATVIPLTGDALVWGWAAPIALGALLVGTIALILFRRAGKKG